MKIQYNVSIPPSIRAVNKEYRAILDFYKSSNKSMSIEYDSIVEAKNRAGSTRTFIRRNNYPIVQTRKENIIYFIKEEV